MHPTHMPHCNECGTMLSDQGYCKYCKFFPSMQDIVLQLSYMILDNHEEENREQLRENRSTFCKTMR